MRVLENVTSSASVHVFEASSGVFHGLLAEMRELSKKKPDATLSKSKVRILNRILTDIRGILREEPEGKYLELLDDDDLPQNSDAVLVMVQFETALRGFERRYKVGLGLDRQWVTEETVEELQAWEEEED